MLIYIYIFFYQKRSLFTCISPDSYIKVSSLVREFLNSFLGFVFLADWFLFFIEIMSRCEMSMVLKWSTRTNCISGNKRIHDKANDEALFKKMFHCFEDFATLEKCSVKPHAN